MPTPSDAHVIGFPDLCINSLLHLRLDTRAMIWKLFVLKQRPLLREVLSGGNGVGPLRKRWGAALVVCNDVNLARSIIQTPEKIVITLV